MTQAAPTPVPYDPALIEGVEALRAQTQRNGHLLAHNIAERRNPPPQLADMVRDVIGDRPVSAQDRTIPGPAGDLAITIVRPTRGVTSRAAIFHIHGGGMMLGNRFERFDGVVDWVERYGIVAVLNDYRLAPEHPHPALTEDCYAGLVWTSEHADELGFDRDRLVVMGGSAGGGLSAAVSLMARDRGGPALLGQLLLCPMIDDRDETVSTLQYDDFGPWNRTSNLTGWTALLGDHRGGPDVSPYAAPARTTDFANLPPAYIEVGAAEVFRDEDVAYASSIWAAGGQAELHVMAGAHHGFEMGHPDIPLARATFAARDSWFERIIGHKSEA